MNQPECSGPFLHDAVNSVVHTLPKRIVLGDLARNNYMFRYYSISLRLTEECAFFIHYESKLQPFLLILDQSTFSIEHILTLFFWVAGCNSSATVLTEVSRFFECCKNASNSVHFLRSWDLLGCFSSPGHLLVCPPSLEFHLTKKMRL